MWWDAALIETTVTRQFVQSHLLPEEIERLDRPLAFGDGLTDETYLDWISSRAKRIFLILVELGVPDQIFGVIDDSWDDDDLPIALDNVGRLALTATKDDRTEKKFYYGQFHYLLKPLEKGEHMIYQDPEVVPVDVVDKRQSLPHGHGHGHHHTIDRVTVPGEPGRVFLRRRIPIGSGPGCLAHEDLQYEIDSIKNLQNDHLVSYWGSYVHHGQGYVLFTPASDLSLKSFLTSFLTTTPASVKNLDKQTRRQLVFNWIHCLVDTLCFIHSRALSHGNIRPSNVLFNNENHIFFSDLTRLGAEAPASGADKASFDKESYDYAAPEQWFKPSALAAASAHQRKPAPWPSMSPETAATFSISRAGDLASLITMKHAPNPHLDPQAADVFSLGCIILELLGFLLKRQTRAFATHRAAKHKTPGRGGAVLDSSFHRNLGQSESWMTGLAKEAAKKDDRMFRGVAPMLHVVERMLSLYPTERPSIHDVQARMYRILTEDCGISEPHCVHRYGGWDYNLGGLKLSTTATASGSEAGDRKSIVSAKRRSGYRWAPARTDSWGGSSRTTIVASSSDTSYDFPPFSSPTEEEAGELYRYVLDAATLTPKSPQANWNFSPIPSRSVAA